MKNREEEDEQKIVKIESTEVPQAVLGWHSAFDPHWLQEVL